MMRLIVDTALFDNLCDIARRLYFGITFEYPFDGPKHGCMVMINGAQCPWCYRGTFEEHAADCRLRAVVAEMAEERAPRSVG